MNPQAHAVTFWLHGAPKPSPSYTGVWHTWRYNGKLMSEEHYRSGKLHGVARFWDENGQLESERNFVNGLKHGTFRWFHTNGNISASGQYTNNLKIGLWSQFYPDGKKKFEKFFSKPDEQEGEERSWTTDGTMTVVRVWRQGEPWTGEFVLKHGTNWHLDKISNGVLTSRGDYNPFLGRVRGQRRGEITNPPSAVVRTNSP